MIIDAPRSISPLKDLWRIAFGDPDGFIDDFFALAYCPRRCLCAYEADRLAGALYWFDCTCRGQKMAYLYAVATDPGFRGRGFCRALLEDLCTRKELKNMAERLSAAKLLMEGKTYNQVIAETDISSATLSRISRCVQYGEGYTKVLKEK